MRRSKGSEGSWQAWAAHTMQMDPHSCGATFQSMRATALVLTGVAPLRLACHTLSVAAHADAAAPL